MNMPQELDYTTLRWVKDEIDESLKQTQQALEAFVENPEDKTQIRFCTTYLHQIYGTLQMVEIYGGALLAEEMEILTQALYDDKVNQKDDAYDVLMRAILQLPSYLEHIEQGQSDQPVILLPLLNDLRAARGENLLSSNAFFSPNMSVSPPPSVAKDKAPSKPVELRSYAKKLRTAYQAALVGFYRSTNTKASLKKIASVLRELHNHANNENAARLWWVASGVIEGIFEDGIETHNSVKLLLGQIDREIKRLVDQGEDAMVNDPPAELVKNLLYYVATAKSSGKRVEQIKAAFELEKILPRGDVDEAFSNLRGSANDLLKSVSTVIKEDLLQVKDQLDIFVRAKNPEPAELVPLNERLGRIADTLAMLGFGDLRKIIQEQINNVDHLIKQGETPNEKGLMEIASALLYVESSLDGIETRHLQQDSDGHDDSPETLLPASEQKQLSKLVINEASEVLSQVKESFNAFANDTSKLELLAEIPAYLSQVKGVLAVLSFKQASNLLQRAIDYIRDEILERRNSPNQMALDAIADVITSIEYYLEAVLDQRRNPESILDVAQRSITMLGYEPGADVEASAPSKPSKPESIDEQVTVTSDADEPVPADSNVIELESAATDKAETAEESELLAMDFTPEVDEAQIETTATAPQAGFDAGLDEDLDEEILEIFIEEADEVLVTMKENLAAWRNDHANREALDVLRRSYHTIKGSGRLAGASTIGEFAWSIENLLNRVIDGVREATPDLFQLLNRAEGVLELLVAQLKGQRGPVDGVQEISEQALALAEGREITAGKPAPDVPSPATSSIHAAALAENPALASMLTQDMTLREIFHREAGIHLDNIKNYIENYDDESEQWVSEPLMRALHTLHGSARMAEVDEIAQIGGALDQYFRTMHDTHQPVTGDAIDVLQAGIDMIGTMRDQLDKDDREIPVFTDILERVRYLHDEAEAASINEMDEGDEELFAIFMEEAGDILDQINSAIMAAGESDPKETIQACQRALHTLKGGARMAGIKPVAELSYHLEHLLESQLGDETAISEPLLQLIKDCHEWLNDALGAIYAKTPMPGSSTLMSRIQDFQPAEEPSAASASPSIEASSAEPSSNKSKFGLETLEIDFSPMEADLASETGQFVAASEYDDELVHIFIEEAAEIQETIDHELEAWREDLDNLAHVAALQRALHTLKGGARMANIKVISDVAHSLETLLEGISEQRIAVDARQPEIAQRCHDWLAGAIDAIRSHITPASADDLLIAIDAAAHAVAPPAEEAVIEPAEPEADDTVAEFDFDLVDDTPEPEPQDEDEIVAAEPEEVIEADVVEPEAPVAAKEQEEPAELNIEFEISERKLAPTDKQPEAKEPEPTFITPAFEIPDMKVSTQAEQAAASVEYDMDLLEVFLEEADEIQDNCDRIIEQWSQDIGNRQLIGELQRALHTLKGGARMSNISAIGNLSHAIETLLEAVTEGQLSPTADFPRLVHRCHDWLSSAIESVKQLKPLQEANALLQQLETLSSGGTVRIEDTSVELEAPSEAELLPPTELIELPIAETQQIEVAPLRAIETGVRNRDEQIRIRAELIDYLVNSAGEISIYNSRIGQQLGDWRFNLTELNQTVHRLQEQLRKFEIEAEAQIMYRHAGSIAHEDDFDPLEMDRFSNMQQLSRGLLESVNDLTSIQSLLENNFSEADVLLLQQSRINSELQEGLMRTRMTPFSSILARLRRIVRQTCQETKKEANLNVFGAEGEMDRTQLNRIVPALEHILRNAIDHGVESPDLREQNGKPREGNVNIHFTREGSQVMLRISDDGAGINIAALREKAIERGLISARSKLDDSELTEFILQSGFSTAEQVTQISGRGIGMDVVNTEIKQLNGSFQIETEQGKGTTFIVRLPLTVLVNNALLIAVDEAIYAIQLSNIEHVIRATGDELGRLSSGEEEFYEYAGHRYQHIHLGYVLHGTAPKPISGKQRQPLLLGRSGEHRVALQLDSLIGRQEIVIKSVGPQLSSVANISGATILPDGKVALILDVSTLIRTHLALQQLAEEEEEQGILPAYVEPEAEIKPTNVLIVDDSITVRKVTERLLKRHNYATYTAKDGIDALTQMLEFIPDIMLLDVEMPRMDGYELAQTMRNDPRLKDIPIIMITSRTGDKHRERAMSVGVNMYMGKPYHEHDLLENVETLLNNR